jgi:branched-chain amino acid transport system ATP-binding protein
MATATLPSPAGNPLLHAAGLRKSFGALAAVDDLSFDVWTGQIFGIAGPNGSGKSTLFNILTAIPFRPDAGEVVFAGRSLTGMPSHRIARSGLVRSFQKDATFDTLSARQTIGVAGAQTSARGSAEMAETERLLDLVHFPAQRRDEASGSLPIFDKKRLAIASALALRPRLLLLDEPASGLTKPEISDLRQLILGVRDHGVTIMLVEHVLSLLLAVSDTLFVMNNGKVIAHGEPEAIIREPAVVEAYLGRRAPI